MAYFKGNRYIVKINGYPAETDKPSYEAGERVKFFLYIVMDGSYEIEGADDLKMIGLEDGMDGKGMLAYEFTMPDHDVDLDVHVRSDMLALPGSFMRQEEGMGREGGTGDTEGIVVCPDCGKRYTVPAPAFCPECGCRIRK